MKLNNKGMSIIEIVVTFTLIMFLVTGLLIIVVNYRNKAAIILQKLDLDTFKNTLTQDVNNDILNYGVVEMNFNADCASLHLNRCINIVYHDPNDSTKTITKVLGTSEIFTKKGDDVSSQKESIENKYIYYDGMKYPLHEKLPDKLPNDRAYYDLSAIRINDDAILNSKFTVLEDGTKVYIYTIDIEVSHIDFQDDFGLHIVASTDNISM